MSEVAMESRAITGQMGLFDKLPDDLVLSNILSRLDLKTLCQSLLVAKGFASIIYRIQTVTINIPDNDDTSHWNDDHCNYDVLLPKVLCSSKEELMESNMLGFNRSLEKFRELKFIRVEFDSHNFTHSPIKMRLLCRSIGPQMQSFIVVLPASIRMLTKQGVSEEEPLDKHNPIEFMESEILHTERQKIQGIGEWAVVILLLIKCHGQLDSITIADSNRHGEYDDHEEVFVVKGKQLVEWRELLNKEYTKNQMSTVSILPKNLYLPVSRYVMKKTVFISLASKVESAHEDVGTWNHNGEQELLVEAFKSVGDSIQQKHSFLFARAKHEEDRPQSSKWKQVYDRVRGVIHHWTGYAC